jgi:hypothetical protein
VAHRPKPHTGVVRAVSEPGQMCPSFVGCDIFSPTNELSPNGNSLSGYFIFPVIALLLIHIHFIFNLFALGNCIKLLENWLRTSLNKWNQWEIY